MQPFSALHLPALIPSVASSLAPAAMKQVLAGYAAVENNTRYGCNLAGFSASVTLQK